MKRWTAWLGEHNHGDEAAEMVREGEMSLWTYRQLHPEARLSEAERAELVRGLVATFGEREAEPERGAGSGGHRHRAGRDSDSHAQP